jgi:hypothetical protein
MKVKLRWIDCPVRIFAGVRHEERERGRERGVLERVFGGKGRGGI